MPSDVIIVGAGLAGLGCARRLSQAGFQPLVLEAADAVGGRIRTDIVDGFRLDRGFQVFLTSYPEAKAVLDYPALELKPFQPGALVRCNGKFHRLSDPWRSPLAGLKSAFSPVGTLFDKLRVGRLRARSLAGSLEDKFREPDISTIQYLVDAGFSPAMIERFFRPFLGGIFLDAGLETSNRMFQFVFRMFSSGDACLPALGMEAIPRQLAAGLPAESIRFNSEVVRIEAGSVHLASGEVLQARAIVVAAEGPAAAKLLGDSTPQIGPGVTCLYFTAPKTPVEEPILVLNGEGRGPINNLCVPSIVSPSYAPVGRHLISVTVLGTSTDELSLEIAVRGQLAEWYGSGVEDWRLLRSYRIPYALPRQFPGALEPPERPVRGQPGLYVCGDHRDNASIQGALVSGRRAAEAVLQDFGSKPVGEVA